MTWRTIFLFLSAFLFFRCTDTTDKNENSPNLVITDSIVKPSNDCDFLYDTISDEKYKMHLVILDKYYNKKKRGYYFKSNGDTLNNFLYHQDIAVFANGLDSTEEGLYKKLTNKVVFLIIEHEPKMLDYGLTQWTRNIKDLDYFMYHVSHPTCNTISIDSIKSVIKTEMGESHDGAKKVKQILLYNLEAGKK